MHRRQHWLGQSSKTIMCSSVSSAAEKRRRDALAAAFEGLRDALGAPRRTEKRDLLEQALHVLTSTAAHNQALAQSNDTMMQYLWATTTPAMHGSPVAMTSSAPTAAAACRGACESVSGPTWPVPVPAALRGESRVPGRVPHAGPRRAHAAVVLLPRARGRRVAREAAVAQVCGLQPRGRLRGLPPRLPALEGEGSAFAYVALRGGEELTTHILELQ